MIGNIIIVTHSFSPGTSQALRDYFIRKNKEVFFIEHPLFGNVLSWSVGFIDTLWKVVRVSKKFDLYIGSNNLNAFAGIVFKKIGLVKKVIFFTPDYSHSRFNNKILNNIYFWLDYFCLRESDLVWNSSSIMPLDFMIQEREKRGVPKKYRKKQISVPDGTDNVDIPSFEKIDRYKIGFVGHLIEGMGVDFLIDSFLEIKKKNSKVKLLIIGSGPQEEHLREKSEGLEVEFTGFIGDLGKVYELIKYCVVAVAPYKKGTISEYTDPGKVKNYLSAGLPIVITKVPKVAWEIDKAKCGFAVECDKKDFAKAVIKLLENDSLLKEYRKNTKKLADKYRWDNVFNRALSYLN